MNLLCIKRWSVRSGSVVANIIDGVQGGENTVCWDGQVICSDKQPESI